MRLLEAHQLALDLMREHGIDEDGWSFEFDGAKRRFGCTHYSLKRITISKVLTELNTIEHFRNTMLHEIAHVLAGKDSRAHGAEWKAIAISIGCTGARTYGREVNKPAVVRRQARLFIGTCPNGHIRYARRRRNVSCGKCDRTTYNPDYQIAWSEA